jgi:hypothetical protein
MSILEQLQANSIKELSVSDPADEVFGDVGKLLDALDENTSLEEVRFDGHFLGDLRNDARSKVLLAIGSITSMKEIYLADSLLLVMDIAKMVEKASNLETLTLHKLVLQGIEQDFDSFQAVLHAHPSLKIFEMDDSIPAVKGISMDKLTESAEKLTIGSPRHNGAGAKSA